MLTSKDIYDALYVNNKSIIDLHTMLDEMILHAQDLHKEKEEERLAREAEEKALQEAAENIVKASEKYLLLSGIMDEPLTEEEVEEAVKMIRETNIRFI